jgi:hypothetical protein
MNDYAMASPPVRGGMKFKHILILLLVAFVGGAVGTGWLAKRLGYWDGNFTAEIEPLVKVTTAPTAPAFSTVAPPDDTVSNIENRLTQINADAAAASGNAARAEGLLVAFAARRAIDSGAQLGYLADQLRLRFGTSQPQAVATILSASQAPVTLEGLQAELKGLESGLINGDNNAGIWTKVSREMSELFVLRRDGAPSPAPTQRMLRAHTLVESGNINGAIVEVSAMPGAAKAQPWLAKARRYIQARKALDRLERSALVAPAPALIIAPTEPLPDAVPVPAPAE